MTLPKLRAPRCCPRQRKDRSGLALPEVSAGSALAGLRGMNNERLEVVLPHGRRDHPVQVPPVARWERSFLTKVKLLRVTGTYPLATLRSSSLICPHRPDRKSTRLNSSN